MRWCASAAALLALAAMAGEPAAAQIEGVPAEIDAPDAAEWVVLKPGTRLRTRPDTRSPSLALIDVATEVEVLERRDGWLRVRHAEQVGWVLESDGGAIPGAALLDSTEPDSWWLARAREQLGDAGAAERRLGPFSLYSDVRDAELLGLLDRVAAGLADAYRRRFGLDPAGEAREAVVLFSDERRYRGFEHRGRGVADTRARGHTRRGIALVFAGRQEPAEVAAILVHELSHLLNRRVLPSNLPPWLEEGTANDLAFCRIDDGGRLVPGTIGGRSVVIEHPVYLPGGWSRVDREVRLEGPLASLSLLQKRRRRGRTLPLALLTGLGWSEFADPGDQRLHYEQSAFFVRYLLEGGLDEGFRAFLASLAGGGEGGPEALLAHLGRDWEELEEGFARWLAEAGRAAGGGTIRR